jgi:hypothetical protein
LGGWTPTQSGGALAIGILYDEDVAVRLLHGPVLPADLFRPARSGRVRC